MKKFITIFLMFFMIVGCSNKEIKTINPDEITFGTLKIHKDGTLVKDIRLTENGKLLKETVENYNNAKFFSVEEDENQVNIDPIPTDGNLEEELSASYFTINVESTGNDYYIGYKGDNIFKVIASGDSFKDRPFEYFVESEELKEIIIENE
ncbi:hypothetical protein [Terrihalobacillus insolitus]|uniref:hypothetical protein n=1 Tax=Terrihalobacillus insolitus TaxID=2950438 RepID=UPI0023407A83|nr:hypothetical protein [Terrihalobacillus insolitus]MDC3413173.1 hypothetical protein [Terrihalobacillus insolitus]